MFCLFQTENPQYPIEELNDYAFKNNLSLDWLLLGNGVIKGANSEAVASLLEVLQNKPLLEREKLEKLITMITSKWPMNKGEIELLVELAN